MPIAPILSTLTPASQTAGKIATVENFKITDIPQAMDTLGWIQSARLMRKWFANPAYEIPKSIKLGDVSANTLSPAQLLTDLPFDWLLKSSTRVRPIVEEQVAQLSSVTEFNGTIGRLKNPLDQLSKGLLQLMTRLKRIGVLNEKKGTLQSHFLDFSGQSAMQLEETSQFNWFPIGASIWEKATDELDDVYGALGSFIIKLAATKIRTYPNYLGQAAIEIKEIGLYVRDTYDFLNARTDQLLGYWQKNGVIRPDPIEYFTEPEYIDKNSLRHFKVTNNSYNQYRNKHGKGGDFLVLSTVEHYPVSIMIHLNKTDFEEYSERTGRS
jgi:hypothetical protein